MLSERTDGAMSGVQIGIYRPGRILTNQEIVDGDGEGKLTTDRILHSVGAQIRYRVTEGETALSMVKAAALQTGQTSDTEVLYASASHPDGRNNLALSLIHQLKLDPADVEHCDYHFACSGWGEEVVDIFKNRWRLSGKRTLLASSETYSDTLLDPMDEGVFSDGSVVFNGVYGKDYEVLAAKSVEMPKDLAHIITMRINRDLMVAPYKSYDIPYSAHFHQNGYEVRKAMEAIIPTEIVNIMEEANLTPEEIDYVIPHQGSSYMVRSIDHRLQRMGFAAGQVVYDNEEGNWSSGSIPKALYGILQKKDPEKVIIVLEAAFGAGPYGALDVMRLK